MSRWPVRTLQERFEEKFEKITESGCWIWTGTVNNTGYGLIMASPGKVKCAHVISYEIYVGEIPEGDGFHGNCVLHSCDIRCCVNPNHLRIGTQSENIQDCVKRNRHYSPSLFGEQNPRSKLTNNQISEIRDIGKTRTQKQIAETYGVSQSHISEVLNGKYRKNG
ncbi:MAG: HNH endonuclease [Nitrospinae bacterium]|nr:HNH endonuclease [Nitrospinota bacterium]